MKKAIVIYDTRFGNTEKIASALKRGMRKQGVKVDCAKADEVDVYRLVEYDFLAIGGPTHGFGVFKPIKAFLEKLRAWTLRARKLLPSTPS